MAVLISNGTSVAHATSSADMINKISQFITGIVTYSASLLVGGVRLTYMRNRASAVAETWTITCTNAGSNTWSVTGSVSGAQASATVGTPYDNGFIAFTLTAVTGANVVGDNYTMQVETANALTTSNINWDLIRIYTASGIKIHFFRGRGASNTDQIFVSLFQSDTTASDIYNVGIVGATGHLLTDDTTSGHPGTSQPVYILLLSGSAMPFWIIANGRRFMAIVKVNTVFQSMYAGFILPTGTPSEYPYPLAIGGCHQSTAVRYSSTSLAHTAFFKIAEYDNASQDSLLLRDKSGVWAVSSLTSTSASLSTLPYHRGGNTFNTLLRNLDNSYTLFPVTIFQRSNKNVYGDFDGVFAISGEGNASENIAQVSGVNHLVFQNTFRTSLSNFAAFKLE